MLQLEARLRKDVFQEGKSQVYLYTEEGVGEETQQNQKELCLGRLESGGWEHDLLRGRRTQEKTDEIQRNSELAQKGVVSSACWCGEEAA